MDPHPYTLTAVTKVNRATFALMTFLLRHSNATTVPPCDPDPSGQYTGDGGDEETAYGAYCLDYMLAHPDGSPISPDVLTFNW